MEQLSLALVSSLLAGLATGLGALPVFFKRAFSEDTMDAFLGFAAGVMLAAAFFRLLIPATQLGDFWMVVVGIAVGALALHYVDRFVPHFHPVSGPEGPPSRLPRTWLFVMTMIIHNFPEGLAVGVSFGSADASAGFVMATAIGVQNMPEGLAVALPLVRENYGKIKSLAYAALTGLAEPVGSFVGVALSSLSQLVLPFGLAFAAGAMIFVIVDEMVPESHRKGFGRRATFGLMSGLVLMIVLDGAFI